MNESIINSNDEKELTPGELKIAEYTQRINEGESKEDIFEGLPESFKSSIEKNLNKKEATYEITENLTYSIEDIKIPAQYEGLPVEIVEELWVNPIYIDQKKNEQETVRREAVLKILKQREEQDSSRKIRVEDAHELSKIRSNLGIESPEALEGYREKHIPTQEILIENDIERISQQEVFGDLNGSHDSFIDHLENRDLIKVSDEDVEWVGGNKNVTFIGDITGDRIPEGQKTCKDLYRLNKEAQKSGGSVDSLAGNHENMYNAMITGFATESGGVSLEEDMKDRLVDYPGNLEWAVYLDEAKIGEIIDSIRSDKDGILGVPGNGEGIYYILEKKRKTLSFLENNPDADDAVIENYRIQVESYQAEVIDPLEKLLLDGSPKDREALLEMLAFAEHLPKIHKVGIGKEILDNQKDIIKKVSEEDPELIEAICSQKIMSLKDDILYTHANLTVNMTKMIFTWTENKNLSLSDSVEKINSFYQETLRWYLSPEPREPETLTDDNLKYFNAIRNEFLSTSKASRVNYSEDPSLSEEDKVEITRKFKDLGVSMTIHGHSDEGGKVQGQDGMPILSIDRSVYKGEGDNRKDPIAHAVVGTDGKVLYH